MAEDATPAGSWFPYSLETLEKLVREIGLAQHGRDFDHAVPDPADASGWIIVLKDGTSDYARIGCIRR